MIGSALPEGLPASLVKRIQDAAIEAARTALTARRFLDFEGPLGAGVLAIEVGRTIEAEIIHEPQPARLVAQRTLPVPMLYSSFRIPVRQFMGARDQSLPLNTRPAEDAAQAVADAEEQLIYHGSPALGIHGLANAPESPHVTLGDWTRPGQAIQDMIAAADRLDAANAHPPYALVLAPPLYNALFRLYEGTDVLQLDHLNRVAAAGVFKSHALRHGALLVSRDVGPLICSQDLEVRFIANAEAALVFEVSEAVVLRLDDPQAVCVLGE